MMNKDDMKNYASKYGPLLGALVAIAIAVVPAVKGNYESYRLNNREDSAAREVSCQTLLADVRQERNQFLNDANKLRMDMSDLRVDLTEEIARLRAEIRLDRRADYDSQVSRWRLDEDLRLTWFNRAFRVQVLDPMGLQDTAVFGKTWIDFLPREVAENANMTDNRVRRTLRPLSYDDGFSIEKRQSGKYKVYWRVIKEPLVDDNDSFHGLRASAVPYREEKIE